MKQILCVLSLTMAFFSCSQHVEDNSGDVQENSDMVQQAKTFASMHNECLDYIYEDVIKTMTRGASSKDVVENAVEQSVNDYVSLHMPTTKSEEDLVKLSEFYSITLDQIENQVSEAEMVYISKAITLGPNNISDDFLRDISIDTNIPANKRAAVICFITTYQASYLYWSENLQDWDLGFKENQTRIDIDEQKVKSVLFADAWWGYQGLAASGLNPIVGIGAAGLASGLTAIFG